MAIEQEQGLQNGVKIGDYTLKTFHHRPGIVQIRNATDKIAEVPSDQFESTLGELFNEFA